MTFSADSKRLYGIRVEPDRRTLFLLDIATKEVKTIGEISKDFTPSSYNNPGVRLSRGGWTKYGRCCPIVRSCSSPSGRWGLRRAGRRRRMRPADRAFFLR
jgi:hypothetical protein